MTSVELRSREKHEIIRYYLEIMHLETGPAEMLSQLYNPKTQAHL